VSQDQVVARHGEKNGTAGQAQTAAYIAELLQELEALARRDDIKELELLLRDARETAQSLAGL